MEKTLYTQEGSKYLLKVASDVSLNVTALQPYFVTPKVRVNLGDPPFDPAFFNSLRINTTKKIVPISLSMGYLNLQTLAIDTDITSVYYQLWRSDLIVSVVPSYDHLSACGKMYPLSEKVFVNSDVLYQYSTKYNQAVLSDYDFIDFSIGSTLVFVPQIPFSIINSQPFDGSAGLITAYDVSINFTYFELQ